MLEAEVLLNHALGLLEELNCESVFLFLNTVEDCRSFVESDVAKERIVVVIPQGLSEGHRLMQKSGAGIIRSWSGNQSRFSRIKYAFMHGVMDGCISDVSRVLCVLGPWGSSRLDTLTIHDLGKSWSEEFPFDPRNLINNHSFHIVLAMVDIAMDIGTSGREGKPVGTCFVIGDTENVLRASHQAVFNPFKGYPRQERHITSPEVVESVKELALLDGAILISEEGFAVAAGRHLDATSTSMNLARGLGARHRAAAGITTLTGAVAIVVSGSSGKITVFEKGRTVASFEPVTGRRLV